MADDLNSTTHKVIHVNDRRRRRRVRCLLRIGGLALILLLFTLLVYYDEDSTPTHDSVETSQRMQQLEEQLRRRNAEFENYANRFWTKIYSLESVVAQQKHELEVVRQQLNEATNEAAQHSKNREIEKQRRKRYEQALQSSEREKSEQKMRFREEIDKLNLAKTQCEAQLQRDGLVTPKAPNEFGQRKGRTQSEERQPTNQRSTEQGSKKQLNCADWNSVGQCAGRCLRQDLRGMLACQKRCLGDEGCFAELFDISSWLGNRRKWHQGM